MDSEFVTDITWFPNSWIRLRIDQRIIYFDPAYLRTYFSNYKDKIEFSKWPDPIDGLPNGLEKADFIFITHHHMDHCKKVTVDRLRKTDTKIYAPKSCTKELGNNFQLIRPGETVDIESNLALTAMNAYNTVYGTSKIKQHKKGVGVGYILTANGKSFYHLGDTDFLDEMAELDHIDVAFVQIGGKFTMNFRGAIVATLAINPKIVIPIHNLDQDFVAFENELKATGKNINCIVPAIGKVIEVL